MVVSNDQQQHTLLAMLNPKQIPELISKILKHQNVNQLHMVYINYIQLLQIVTNQKHFLYQNIVLQHHQQLVIKHSTNKTMIKLMIVLQMTSQIHLHIQELMVSSINNFQVHFLFPINNLIKKIV